MVFESAVYGKYDKWKRYTIKEHLRRVLIVAERLMVCCGGRCRSLSLFDAIIAYLLGYLGISQLKGGENHGSQKGYDDSV